LDPRIPPGPLPDKWKACQASLRLVSPANRGRYQVLVVGAGLAGAGCASALAEQGYPVSLLTILDSPRRSHSVAAQGGINGAKNYPNDGDGVGRMYRDTLKGGDFRAREASVYRLAELSVRVIDYCVSQGIPFAREYGGGLSNRSFGGVQVSRTFYARGATGQQLLLGVYGALQRQVEAGRVRLLPRREMLDLMVEGGRARGVICRNLLNGALEAWAADVVVMATGGYSSVYCLSTNALNSNASAIWRCHRRGAWLANPSLVQFHPTCLPELSPFQSKLTLMSEGLRNDGRVWVPRTAGDARPAHQIPEAERDYYLERLYPNFGNLVPRDIASREAMTVLAEGRGVGLGGRAVYLDFRDTPRERLEEHYGNLFAMYREITAEDPYLVPMRISPAPHFSMGGLWVDYHLRTNLPGLFALGEANCADHGANRLGANSLLQTLVDGLFVAPLVIADELATQGPSELGVGHALFRTGLEACQRRLEGYLQRAGTRTPQEFHRTLGEILRRHVGLSRTEASLRQAATAIRELREAYQADLLVSPGNELNQDLERAGRVEDFLELAELMVVDALARRECCGAHFRADLPEARDDEEFAHVAAWEWSGDASNPRLHKEPLRFELTQPGARSY